MTIGPRRFDEAVDPGSFDAVVAISHQYRRRRKARWRVCLALASALLSGSIRPVVGQAVAREIPAQTQRGRELEKEFQEYRESAGWTFYHSIDSLPPDLHAILLCIAGTAVVDPGESFNTGDVLYYPSSDQHLYTAVRDNLSVIVWLSGGFNGVQSSVLLYDRQVRDAVRYFLGRAGPVFRLHNELWAWMHAARERPRGYRYLPPDFNKQNVPGICLP